MPSLDRRISSSRRALEERRGSRPLTELEEAVRHMDAIRPFTEGIVGEEISFVLRIGAANQSCPVLVLEDATEPPPGGQRSVQTGTVFVAGPTAICNYLARRVGANLPVPHP